MVVSLGAVGADRLLWVAMITSAGNRAWSGDVSFGETFAAAGLPAPSVKMALKIATIETSHAEVIGRADPMLTRRVMAAIGATMGLRG